MRDNSAIDSARLRSSTHLPLHQYKYTAPSSTDSFRSTSTDQQATRAVCFSKPHQDMEEYHEETLSEGDSAFSTRVKLGHLIDR